MWKLTFNKKPYTSNQARTWHYHQHAREAQLWKHAYHSQALAKKIPKLGSVQIVVRATYKGRMADTDAIAPCVKACIDGIVSAGVLKDDQGKFVRTITYLAPKKGRQDSLTIYIKNIEEKE